MPNGTDTRIVQMQFDNRQFEKNIRTSEKSLERFKKYLDFDACERSLSKFGKAAEQLTFDKMADNLQKLTDKFTGLGTVSELIISQVRHGLESAAASARRFVNSLTMDQVNEGLNKFGQLNKNVQTIMSATGRSEEDVYRVLQRLNQYTDQTSYSFTDMAANIGKFTSVGIGLEDAEKQMEGIANWAARSGGGIQEASRAMYNLSQAMGVGALTKIDWKSIENAGMATKEFKEQLIQAGLAVGTLVKQNGKIMTDKSLGKQVEVTYQNVADTLQKRWATTQVMQNSFMSYYYENIMYDEELEKAIKLSDDQIKNFNKIFEDSKAITEKNWKELSASNGLDDNAKSAELYAATLKKAADEEERFGRGNIDLNKRKVVFNSDGTISTERSFSVNVDGKEILLPTVVEGKIVSEDEAIQHYFETGEHLGIFDTIDEATAYADKLHNEQDKYYSDLLKTASLGDKISLTTNEAKELAIEAGLALGNITEVGVKNGQKLYKTSESLGKSVEFTIDEFEKGLRGNWLTKDVAKQVWGFDSLARSAYEAAQKCTTFTDVINAWKDQLSTGWMNSYTKIFGELSESMELFSNICNKVGNAFSNLIDLRNGILDVWGAKDGPNSGRKNLWALIVGEVTEDGEAVAYEGAYGFLDVLGDIGNMISTAFWETLKMFADPAGQLNWDESGYKEAWIASTLDYAILSVREFLSTIREFFNASAEGSKKSRWQEIQDVVNAIFATFVLAESVIRDVITGISILLDQEHFGPAIDALLHMFSELGLTISSSAQDAERGHGLIYLFRQLDVTCRPLISALNELIVTFADLIAEFLKTGRENGDFKAFWDVVVSGINSLAAVITKYGTPIIKFFTSFIGTVGRLLQNGINTDNLVIAGQELKASLKTMLDSLFDGIPNFSERVSALWDTIKNWFANGFKQEDWEALKAKLKSALKTILDILPEGWGESITSTYNKLKASFSEFVEKIKGFFSSVVEAFKAGFSAESLAKIGDKAKSLWSSVVNAIPEGIGKAVTNAYNAVVKYVKDLWNRIVGFFNSLFGGSKENPVDNVVTQMLPGEKAKNAVADAKKNNVFEQIISYLSTSFANLKTNFQLLLGNDKGDAGSSGEALKKLDWGKIMVVILGALGGVGIITVIAKIVGIVKLLIGAFETVKNLVDEGIKIGPEAKKADIGEIALKLAGAFALLTASFAVIANIKADDAWRALGIMVVIGVILMALVGFSKMLYKESSLGEAGSAVMAFVGIGVAIGRVVAALLPLSKLNANQYTTIVNSLWNITAAIVVLSAAAKLGNLSFDGMAGVLAFCAGLWLLINALLKIKDLEPEQFIKMFVGLGGVLAALLLFAKRLNKVGGSMKDTGMKEAAFLAAAVGILIFSLLPLANMRWDQLGKMGAGLGVVLLALGLFVVGVNKLAQGGLSNTGMVQLIAVAGSIIMLVLALMPLALMKWEQLGKMGAGFGVILAALWGFIVGTNKLAQGGLSGTAMAQLLAVAGSIVMIVLALTPLALMRWDQLGKMGAGFVVILAALWGFIVGVNKLTQGGGLKDTGMVQLLAIAGAIALVVLALMPLALMEWDQLARMGAGFVVIMVMFSGIIAASHKLKPQGATSALLLLVGVAALMYIFALSLTKIPKDMNWEKIAAFSGGLALIIAAVGLALKLTKGLTIGGATKSILIISAAVAALIAVFAVVGKFALDSLGSALANLAANLKLFSGMISDFSDRMENVNEDSIHKAEIIIKMLANMLSDIGSIATGSMSSSFLTNMASHLTLTSGMLIDFSSRMNKIELSSFVKAQTMIDQIKLMMLSLAGFEEFTSRREAFTTALFDLGTGIEIFATHTGNVGDMSNNSALQIIKELSGSASDLETIAKMDINKLTSSMTGLGGAMMLYAKGAEEATGIATNTEGAPDVAGAVGLLQDISNSLTKDGGFTIPENMPSDEALGTFGAQLAALAGALVAFEEAGSKLGSGTDKAIECLDFFSKLKAKLSEINMGEAIGAALEAFITKEDVTVQPNELETFGKNIEQLGLALAAFAKSTTIVDESTGAIAPIDYSVAVGALESFSNLANSLPTIGGINGWWNGNKESLIQLAADLEALGQGLKDFSMKVTGKSEDEYEGIASETIEEGKTAATTVVDKAVEVFTKITEVQSKLKPVGAISSIWTGDPPSFTDIAAQLEALGQGLKDFSDKLNGTGESEAKKFDPEAAKSALLVVDSMISTMTDIGIRLPKIGGIGNFFKTLGEGRTSTLSDVGTQIGGLGEGLSGFSTAISGKFGNADEIINALKVVSSVVDMIASMASTGEMISYGNVETYVDYINTFLTEMTSLERGVSGGPDRSQTVVQSLVTMMGEISTAMTTAGNIDSENLDIFSTFVQSLNSLANINMETTLKSFEEVGNNISLGVQRGINSGSSGVIQAAVDMAVAAYKAAKAALDEHSPSRLFMGIGAFASEGMAIGITKSADQAANASESMANSTIDSARGVLANISSILASDVDAQPTITPVLDLSNVTAGARQINGIFGDTYGLGIDPSGARARASRTYAATEAVAIDQNGIDSYGALARLDAMLENVQKMGESISNMKLVLDTGVVAGGVSDDVDLDIGRKMFYAERRN